MRKIIILCNLLIVVLCLSSCFSGDNPTKDNILKINHTITLVDNFGYLKKIYVDDGECLVIKDTPDMENYIFKGWYTDKLCTMLYDFTKPVKNDFTLYADYTLSYVIMSLSNFRIKLDLSVDSYKSFNITPYDFDVDFLKKNGYGIEITVQYSYYYVKDYDVLFDIGYAGSPRFEFSIYNNDGVGYFEKNLPTKKTTQTEVYSVVSDMNFINNKDIFLKFSTDNIQNLIYFKNIIVSIEAVRVR